MQGFGARLRTKAISGECLVKVLSMVALVHLLHFETKASPDAFSLVYCVCVCV